jgi:hypothetical protein
MWKVKKMALLVLDAALSLSEISADPRLWI